MRVCQGRLAALQGHVATRGRSFPAAAPPQPGHPSPSPCLAGGAALEPRDPHACSSASAFTVPLAWDFPLTPQPCTGGFWGPSSGPGPSSAVAGAHGLSSSGRPDTGGLHGMLQGSGAGACWRTERERQASSMAAHAPQAARQRAQQPQQHPAECSEADGFAAPGSGRHRPRDAEAGRDPSMCPEPKPWQQALGASGRSSSTRRRLALGTCQQPHWNIRVRVGHLACRAATGAEPLDKAVEPAAPESIELDRDTTEVEKKALAAWKADAPVSSAEGADKPGGCGQPGGSPMGATIPWKHLGWGALWTGEAAGALAGTCVTANNAVESLPSSHTGAPGSPGVGLQHAAMDHGGPGSATLPCGGSYKANTSGRGPSGIPASPLSPGRAPMGHAGGGPPHATIGSGRGPPGVPASPQSPRRPSAGPAGGPLPPAGHGRPADPPACALHSPTPAQTLGGHGRGAESPVQSLSGHDRSANPAPDMMQSQMPAHTPSTQGDVADSSACLACDMLPALFPGHDSPQAAPSACLPMPHCEPNQACPRASRSEPGWACNDAPMQLVRQTPPVQPAAAPRLSAGNQAAAMHGQETVLGLGSGSQAPQVAQVARVHNQAALGQPAAAAEHGQRNGVRLGSGPHVPRSKQLAALRSQAAVGQLAAAAAEAELAGAHRLRDHLAERVAALTAQRTRCASTVLKAAHPLGYAVKVPAPVTSIVTASSAGRRADLCWQHGQCSAACAFGGGPS